MPTEPAQIAIVLFEICLLLSGAGLVLWLAFNPGARARWFGTNALPVAPASLSNFVLLTVLIFLTGFAFQAAAQLWLGPIIATAADQQGLALFIYSVANYTGALVAWKWMFPSLSRSWAVDPEIPSAAVPPPLPWPKALRYGAGTLAVALPVLSLVSLGWTFLVEQLDLPVVPQDVIGIFTNTKSPFVVAGLLLVACVLAPVYEELLFRAGLYRFCRQNPLGIPMVISLPFAVAAAYIAQVAMTRPGLPADWQLWLLAVGAFVVGVVMFFLTRGQPLVQRHSRGFALVMSGVYFGALHGNWAGFLPLAVLGMGLALAYEATGSIRVPIIAHSLFNLNTVLVLLSGLPELTK